MHEWEVGVSSSSRKLHSLGVILVGVQCLTQPLALTWLLQDENYWLRKGFDMYNMVPV